MLTGENQLGTDDIQVQIRIALLRDLVAKPPTKERVPEETVKDYHADLELFEKALGIDLSNCRVPDKHINKTIVPMPFVGAIARPGVGSVLLPESEPYVSEGRYAPTDEFLRRARVALQLVEPLLATQRSARGRTRTLVEPPNLSLTAESLLGDLLVARDLANPKEFYPFSQENMTNDPMSDIVCLDHPGLPNGRSLVSKSLLAELEEAGLIRTETRTINGDTKTHFNITTRGRDYVKRRQTEVTQRPAAPTRPTKPRVFIGSSTEGLEIANAIQLNLDHEAECTPWTQGPFGLSQNTLASLVKAKDQFDYAVLVLTQDDLVKKRARTKNAPRDNVIFELGFFIGALGQEKTFMVYNRDEPPDLPTDLAGITPATFGNRSDGNLQAALGAVCTQLRQAMGIKKGK